MKSIVGSIFAVAALASASGAFAADLPYRRAAPVYIPPAPIFTWTGFYVGLTAGYGFGQYTQNSRSLFGNADGIVAGATAGYNYQMGSIVLGIEGDLNYSDVEARQTNAVQPIFGKSRLNGFGTVRGRVGYAMDRALFFVTGGYAGGQIHSSIVDGINGVALSDSQYHNGFALGGGIEYALTPNVTAKAEYLYTNFADTQTFSSPDLTRLGLSMSTVRAGINYKF